jgi:hypothetical protein
MEAGWHWGLLFYESPPILIISVGKVNPYKISRKARCNPTLKPVMRPIAQGLVCAGFAATEKGAAIFLGSPFLGLKRRALMRAIAKGLVLRPATGTPEIGFSRRYVDREWPFLGDDGGVVGHLAGLLGWMCPLQTGPPAAQVNPDQSKARV